MIGRLNTQVTDKRLKCPSFRLTDSFCRGAMWESNLFDLSHGLWTRMIHEPTQRVKGMFGDTCNSCCVDQKVSVGIKCLPTHSLFMSITL